LPRVLIASSDVISNSDICAKMIITIIINNIVIFIIIVRINISRRIIFNIIIVTVIIFIVYVTLHFVVTIHVVITLQVVTVSNYYYCLKQRLDANLVIRNLAFTDSYTYFNVFMYLLVKLSLWPDL